LSLRVVVVVVEEIEEEEEDEEEHDEESLTSVQDGGGVGRFLLRINDGDCTRGGIKGAVFIVVIGEKII